MQKKRILFGIEKIQEFLFSINTCLAALLLVISQNKKEPQQHATINASSLSLSEQFPNHRQFLKTMLYHSALEEPNKPLEEASAATHVEWAKWTRPLHPCKSHWPSWEIRKSLWWCFMTISFTASTMLVFSGSCLRPARWFRVCHCLYLSGRSTRSAPSQLRAFSAERPSTTCSSTIRDLLSLGMVASNMSNSAM